ncbi:hypothetical protein B2I21_28105 [Chryseobacterium mucoviscidosis]|nr:hypothetical protein B2I21_28105 [Chryseobacterium mucoviscidosis]
MDTIRNRAQLELLFDNILTRNHTDHAAYQKYGYGRNALKTYIIEIHEINKQTNYDSLLSTLLSKALEVDDKSKVIETEEESLLRLHTSDGDYFIDTTSRRYVILHSASSTKITDRFIRKFQNTKGLDTLWLPVPLLLQTIDFGKLWGIGVKYKEALEDSLIEGNESTEDVQDVSLNINRHFAKNFFQILMKSEFSHMMGLSKVSLLRKEDEGENLQKSSFIIDDIRFDGKITAKGNSYSNHSQVVHNLVDLYSSAISNIESYGLSFEEGFLSGTPITIKFSKRVQPNKLVDFLFSGEEPFRLWGMPNDLGRDQYRVYAVDMHHGNSGAKLTFEIDQEFIRVSLPKYSCGNTILRLLANINHYIDAMATLEVGEFGLKVDLSRAGLS